MQTYDKFFIGGEWVEPAGSDTLKVVSPTTEEVIGSVPVATEADMDRAVEAARAAFAGRVVDLDPGRSAPTSSLRISDGIKQRQDEFANLIIGEVGAPYYFSPCSVRCWPPPWCSTPSPTSPAPSPSRSAATAPSAARSWCAASPSASCAGIIPWNVPLFITMLKLAPALASGSTMVLKPAPETPLDAYVLRRGPRSRPACPPACSTSSPADREVGEHLVRHPGVDKVSFTGSTAAGRKIGAICGEQLKRCTLELGGKSAAILCDDVDLDEAVAQPAAAAAS